MQITTRCPHCSRTYRLPQEQVGRQAKCKCGHVFTVQRVSGVSSAHDSAEPTVPKAGRREQSQTDAAITTSNPPGSGTRRLWILGGSVAGVLAVVAILAGLWLFEDPAEKVDSLIHKLKSGEEQEKLEAVVALGELGPSAREALPALRELLEGANAFTGIVEGSLVDKTASALASVGGQEMIPVWLSAFEGQNLGEVMLAGMVLERIGSEAIPRMCTFLAESRDPRARRALAVQLGTMTILGKAGTNKTLALSSLETCSRQDPDPSVRIAAAQALERISSEDRRPAAQKRNDHVAASNVIPTGILPAAGAATAISVATRPVKPPMNATGVAKRLDVQLGSSKLARLVVLSVSLTPDELHDAETNTNAFVLVDNSGGRYRCVGMGSPMLNDRSIGGDSSLPRRWFDEFIVDGKTYTLLASSDAFYLIMLPEGVIQHYFEDRKMYWGELKAALAADAPAQLEVSLLFEYDGPISGLTLETRVGRRIDIQSR